MTPAALTTIARAAHEHLLDPPSRPWAPPRLPTALPERPGDPEPAAAARAMVVLAKPLVPVALSV